jgi:hypothetical protein
MADMNFSSWFMISVLVYFVDVQKPLDPWQNQVYLLHQSRNICVLQFDHLIHRGFTLNLRIMGLIFSNGSH